MANKKIRDTGANYTVVDLNGKLAGDDLENCMKVLCTNKRSLEEVTRIRYDRLVYLFGKQGRSYLVENGMMILKSTVTYKGKQEGGIKNAGIYRQRSF